MRRLRSLVCALLMVWFVCSRVYAFWTTHEGDDVPKFTPGEQSVMRLLWQDGEMKPSENQKRFPGEIKNPLYASV